MIIAKNDEDKRDNSYSIATHAERYRNLHWSKTGEKVRCCYNVRIGRNIH